MKLTKLILACLIIVAAIPLQVVNAGSISTSINNQTLHEGGSSLNYLLKLSAQPTGDDTVAISWDTNNQCHVAHEGRSYTKSGQLFTTGDSLVFYARAVDDNVQESNHSCSVTYRTSSADPNLHNLSTAQSFTIIDNGDAAATIPTLYTTVLGPSTITEGSGALFTFGIGPSTAPDDTLFISASSADRQCQIISGGRIVSSVEQKIAAGNQGTAVFAVRVTNDSDVEGDHNCSINHSLRTEDLDYSGLPINNTYVPITDDEASFSSQAINAEELLGRSQFGLLSEKDANNDKIADSKQNNLGVFINGISGRRQAIEVTGKNSNCNAVSTPETKAENQLSQENDDFVYPHGLISFRIICDKPGAVAKVSYYLDDLYNTDNIELQKFGQESGYRNISNVEITKFKTQNGLVSLLKYQIKDGSSFDEDGLSNGIIVDPIGIAISEVKPAQPNLAHVESIAPDNNTDSYLIFVIPAVAAVFAGKYFIPKHKHHLRRRIKVRYNKS